MERILISAMGGLGDHITAEPSIRYVRERVYKDADFRIAALWPRAFEHLGVPVYPHNTFEPATGVLYRTIWTTPDPGSPLYNSVNLLLCHMVEYQSMTMLKQMLPLKDRKIRLGVSREDRERLQKMLGGVNPRECVAVHAGKSARTKTFPVPWWQAVVDGLAQAGLRVCLIGKSSSPVAGDDTGVVPIACPKGGIDLRDTLGLGELFALIEAAPVLLSNDSSPVQIAGAFDNTIIMLATVKHPDLVFPYRRGSTQYKTKALYKKLLVNDILFDPSKTEAFSIDFEVPDWSRYLPDPAEVVEEVVALRGS